MGCIATPKRYLVQRTYLILPEQKLVRETLLSTDDLLLAQARLDQTGGSIFDNKTNLVYTKNADCWLPRMIEVAL